MKKRIHIGLFFIALFFPILSGCDSNTSSNNDFYKSNGIITGYDMRECACCGGFFIEIHDSVYRFYELPKETNINFQIDTFPLTVKLDWKKSPTPCMGDEIIVERIKK